MIKEINIARILRDCIISLNPERTGLKWWVGLQVNNGETLENRGFSNLFNVSAKI